MTDMNVKDYEWCISPTGTIVATDDRHGHTLMLRTRGLRHFYLDIVMYDDFRKSEAYDLKNWQVQEIMDQIAEKLSERYAIEITTIV